MSSYRGIDPCEDTERQEIRYRLITGFGVTGASIRVRILKVVYRATLLCKSLTCYRGIDPCEDTESLRWAQAVHRCAAVVNANRRVSHPLL